MQQFRLLMERHGTKAASESLRAKRQRRKYHGNFDSDNSFGEGGCRFSKTYFGSPLKNFALARLQTFPQVLSDCRPMEMDVFPMAGLPLPDARFLAGDSRRRTVGAYALDEASIGHYRHIAHDAHPWRAHRSVVPPFDAAQLEVKPVELHSFH